MEQLDKMEESQTVQTWSYKNKVILAPMVRISTLPLRILAKQYGADIVYSEEIVDKKISKCKRQINEKLNTIEFVNQGKLVFSTYPGEPVSFQIGTANGVNALKAAQIVAQDVRAIDINMGCPKRFSIQGGMGASLLTNLEAITDILTTLKRNLNIPITCKIRLLDSTKQTLELCQVIQQTGASAIAVHVRHIPDRPYHASLPDEIIPLLSSINLPFILNGDVFYTEDIQKVKLRTGVSSVMIARGAQWNCSIFGGSGPNTNTSTPTNDNLKKEEKEKETKNSKGCDLCGQLQKNT